MVYKLGIIKILFKAFLVGVNGQNVQLLVEGEPK